jgi:hypothetical protein
MTIAALITDLGETGAADEIIRDITGHVSKQGLKHYSHIRMAAKRGALESIVTKSKLQEPEGRDQVVEFTQSASRGRGAKSASAA